MATQRSAQKPDTGSSVSRRRRYLVDRRRQLNATLRVVALVSILLALLVGTVAYQNYSATSSVFDDNPELAEAMRATDTRNLLILVAISLIILAMVVVRSIMITHRTAGAVFSISDKLEKIAAGDYTVSLRLREDDTIRALEDPFNKMAKALRRRADEDHRTLTKLANEIEEHGSPVDAEMLRRIADAHGRHVG
jgi:nitrogen fixation/metabolism regulation signal transduction histidine kinase